MVGNKPSKQKRMNMRQCEPIAAAATKAALTRLPFRIPEEKWREVGLEVGIEDPVGFYNFQLVIAGPTPIDAKVLSSARVNRITGQCNAEVFVTGISEDGTLSLKKQNDR